MKMALLIVSYICPNGSEGHLEGSEGQMKGSEGHLEGSEGQLGD